MKMYIKYGVSDEKMNILARKLEGLDKIRMINYDFCGYFLKSIVLFCYEEQKINEKVVFEDIFIFG